MEVETLEGAIAAGTKTFPFLKPHLPNESGLPRMDVSLLFKGENLKWINGRHVALKPGDRLDILQAVSGG